MFTRWCGIRLSDAVITATGEWILKPFSSKKLAKTFSDDGYPLITVALYSFSFATYFRMLSSVKWKEESWRIRKLYLFRHGLVSSAAKVLPRNSATFWPNRYPHQFQCRQTVANSIIDEGSSTISLNAVPVEPEVKSACWPINFEVRLVRALLCNLTSSFVNNGNCVDPKRASGLSLSRPIDQTCSCRMEYWSKSALKAGAVFQAECAQAHHVLATESFSSIGRVFQICIGNGKSRSLINMQLALMSLWILYFMRSEREGFPNPRMVQFEWVFILNRSICPR